MSNSKKYNKGTSSVVTNVITGSVISIALSMLLVAAVSVLVLAGVLDYARTEPAVYLIMFLSVFAGAVSSIRNAVSHIAINVAAICGAYLFALITINIIFYDGMFDHFWLGFAIAISAAVLPVLLYARVRKRERNRYMRRI